jgi:hypothetical protein
MKKNILNMIAGLIAITMVASGCYESNYYHHYHRHSDRYYHHHHMPPPAGVDIEVR